MPDREWYNGLYVTRERAYDYDSAPLVGPLFDLPEGRRLRDEGIDRVESRADTPGTAQVWRDAARDWVTVRATRPGIFNADDLRADMGGPPHHFNAMGGVFMWARKRGLISLAGMRTRQLASAHSQMIPVYEGASFAEAGNESP